MFLVVSCASDQNKDNKVKGAESENTMPDLTNPDGSVTPPGDVQQVNILPDANGTVFHYVCPDNCKGGAANDHGNCPVCGKSMAHNQGFHANENPEGQMNVNDIPGEIKTLNGTPGAAVTPPASVEPPQNAKGVWHYTCSKGCPGGSGAQEACKKCGATLAHNANYHN